MFEKLYGWLLLSLFCAAAVAVPLLMLGVPERAVWPICVACAGVMLIVRPGGTVEKFMQSLVAYGIVFSVWCVAGLLLAIPIALVFSGFRPPELVFFIAAVGVFGVVREAQKPENRPPPEKPGA